MYTDQERYMKEAIRQAKKACALDEVPIGCVIVCDGKIIARKNGNIFIFIKAGNDRYCNIDH